MSREESPTLKEFYDLNNRADPMPILQPHNIWSTAVISAFFKEKPLANTGKPPSRGPRSAPILSHAMYFLRLKGVPQIK